MKFFYKVFSSAFICLASIIGAGFISGRELINFFGEANFLPFFAFSCALIFLFILLIFSFANKSESLYEFNSSVFSRPKAVEISVIIASFISVSAMLAALDSLARIALDCRLPICSALVIILLSVFSKYGVKGAEKLSFIAVPLVIITADIVIFSSPYGLSFGTKTPESNGANLFLGFIGGVVGVIFAALYAGMNAFMNLPPIFETAKSKSRFSLFLSAGFSAVALFTEGALILGAINAAGVSGADMPTLLLASNSGKATVFYASTFLALTCSLFTAYFPLYEKAVNKGGKSGVIILALGAFVASRFGLKNIVKTAYPLIGAVGLIYCAAAAKRSLKNSTILLRIKNARLTIIRLKLFFRRKLCRRERKTKSQN